MALAHPSISRVLLVASFLAVASAAGLQWVGLAAQTEAVRQQASRRRLDEFSSILNNFASAPAKERPAMAGRLAEVAEILAQQIRGESLASASRRVVALASFEAGKEPREKELQERLRAEVRGLVSQAESLEMAALHRAKFLISINQILLVVAVVLCGAQWLRARQIRAEA